MSIYTNAGLVSQGSIESFDICFLSKKTLITDIHLENWCRHCHFAQFLSNIRIYFFHSVVSNTLCLVQIHLQSNLQPLNFIRGHCNKTSTMSLGLAKIWKTNLEIVKRVSSVARLKARFFNHGGPRRKWLQT